MVAPLSFYFWTTRLKNGISMPDLVLPSSRQYAHLPLYMLYTGLTRIPGMDRPEREEMHCSFCSWCDTGSRRCYAFVWSEPS